MDLTQPAKPSIPGAIPAPACGKCGGQMNEGFVLDNSYGTTSVSNWIAGKPEYGVLGNVKTAHKKQMPVHTFACRECGYLESYIRPEAGPKASPR